MHGMNQTEAEYLRQQEVPDSKFELNRPISIGDITTVAAKPLETLIFRDIF